MEVLSIRQVNLELSDLDKRRPLHGERRPRYAGLHQSDVLKYIAVKTGKMAKGEKLEEDYPWRMAMGNMWEEFYFSLHPEYEWQPGERIVDNVAVNCDGVGFSSRPESRGIVTERSLIVETKCTECKVVTIADDLLAKFSANWWVYLHQARAYCHAYGPRTVVWPMLHYRGDWRGSGPMAMEYAVRFTDREVRDTWRMIQANKAEMEEKVLTKGE